MASKVLTRFIVRWLASGLGLWIASGLLGSGRLSVGNTVWTIIWAGLILALVNMALKPILVILSFPAVILSLGLFMLVINAFLILIVHWIYSPLYISSFWVAIVAGIIIGLVNFLVTKILKEI